MCRCRLYGQHFGVVTLSTLLVYISDEALLKFEIFSNLSFSYLTMMQFVLSK